MIVEAQNEAGGSLAAAGDWLTGAERIAAWREVRDAATNVLDEERKQALSPASVDGKHSATDVLSAEAVEVVHRVASDPGRLTRTWADKQMATLGAPTYTELVGVAAIAATIDRFDIAMEGEWQPLPQPVAGEPARVVPDNVGDVGAWVPQALGPTMANVSRTLSGVPQTNDIWRSLVNSHYSRGREFAQLAWDRALSRPQTELVAARVTALSECFY